MTRYQFTPQAADDLFEIWSYIAKESPESADRVEATIIAACEILAGSAIRRCGARRPDDVAGTLLAGACVSELFHRL